MAKPEAEADPGYGGYGHSSAPHCQQHVEKQCHKVPQQHNRQECHQEYDTIVDTTYIEQCQDIVTQHCQETHKQVEMQESIFLDVLIICLCLIFSHLKYFLTLKVHHSSHVVGHDSHVVSHGHGGYHGKREAEAEAEPGYGGYSSGPRCHNNVQKQCHKVPQQHSRKVARPVCKTIVDTTYIEQCQDIVTQHCQQTSQQVHHSSAVVGHDTQVISHGHGYH